MRELSGYDGPVRANTIGLCSDTGLNLGFSGLRASRCDYENCDCEAKHLITDHLLVFNM